MRATMIFSVAALAAALMLLTQASGQTQVKSTVITIDDLDCPTCAKKVEKSVAAVKGVKEVKTDVEKQTATVTPQSDQAPSCKAMWEAVEAAGFKVLKMEGPSGTFTAKPGV